MTDIPSGAGLRPRAISLAKGVALFNDRMLLSIRLKVQTQVVMQRFLYVQTGMCRDGTNFLSYLINFNPSYPETFLETDNSHLLCYTVLAVK